MVRWDSVYEAQPDYQGGELKRGLDEAYPLAARQLIDQASGSERLLDQALGFIEESLALQPDDEELLEERRLIGSRGL